MKEDDACSRLC